MAEIYSIELCSIDVFEIQQLNELTKKEELKMSKMKQLKFFEVAKNPLHFGGEDLNGKRKGLRPLSTTKPLHLVIHPENLERQNSLIKYRPEIETLTFKTAKKFGIIVHDKSINFTHMHLMISFSARTQYTGFVRLLNAGIVRILKLQTGRIFKLRPYTRVVHWGADFQKMQRYLQTNRFEAEGLRIRY